MKIVSYVVGALGLLSGFFDLTCAEQTILGPAQYKNQTFEVPLKIMGPLYADALVAPRITVYGPATVKNSQIGEAMVYGPFASTKSTFSGPVRVRGPLAAVESSFKDDITLSGTTVTVILHDTRTKSIFLRVQNTDKKVLRPGFFSWLFSTKKPKESFIKLVGNTKVDGSLTFEEGTGKVLIENNAQVTGEIVGAKNNNLIKKELHNEQTN